jgi:phenylacetate-coenzyme A ligase PaaK-like adenylate-forming protein
MFLHPRQLKEVMDRFNEVENYQVEVSRVGERDHILLKIHIKGGAYADDNMLRIIKSTFEDLCRLRLDEVICVTAEEIGDKSQKIIDLRVF